MYEQFLPNTGGIAAIAIAGYVLPIWSIGAVFLGAGILSIMIARKLARQ